ncbi:MAG: trypsin-like peptidase domain-containing protein, partial [Chloroflexi bacterium]|nr:trypsin-like peptidase domain-containing protein [Chloroflexota bacterium]
VLRTNGVNLVMIARVILLPIAALTVLLTTGCAAALSEINRPADTVGAASAVPVTIDSAGRDAVASAIVGQSDTTTATTAAPVFSAPSIQALPDIATVVEQVSNAVVAIRSESLEQGFFGFVPREGEGSGFIINKDGYIVTNAHVVGNATKVIVTLPDDRVFPGSVVIGRDQKINADDLPVAKLGSSEGLRVGSWVIAIGNALGFDGKATVTAGIISASERQIQTTPSCRLSHLIQTDAAINPGNSGGPLFNLDGEVIGINTAVQRLTTSGVDVEGVGFAIAIDQALPIIQELIDHGAVAEPWLGVALYDVSARNAALLGLPTKTGVYVDSVYRGSPAEGAGLLRGHIILTIADETIGTITDLQRVVGAHRVGDRVMVTGIDTRGRAFALEVPLGQSPRTCA